MLTLELLWREASPETEVCTIEGATKNMVLRAITEGATNFDSISKRIRLCENNECAKINASERGCCENIQALLNIYLPVFALMTDGGGCQSPQRTLAERENESKRAQGSRSCKGCTLCGE